MQINELKINVKELQNAIDKLTAHDNCNNIELICTIKEDVRTMVLVVPIDDKTEIRYNITEDIDVKAEGLNTLYPDLQV